MSNGWVWSQTRVQEVLQAMAPADRETFNFDLAQIHFPTYLENSMIGIKKFLMREDMGRVEVARWAQRRLGEKIGPLDQCEF